MTGRSHPPSLKRQVERTFQKECSLPTNFKLAVAVSGGPDSMALLDVLGRLRKSIGFELLALSLNHGLRSEAAAEVSLVETFCSTHDIPFATQELGLSAGGNLQGRAREARYQALWIMAEARLGPGCYLATAHHKDDRAETVLLRMLRGTSLEGLAVFRAQHDRLLRPMLRATRKDVEVHIQRHGVPFVTDPSNCDPRFLRVRVRQELLPLLRDLGSGIVDHLEGLADDAGRLDEPGGLNREQREQLRAALKNPQMNLNLLITGGIRLVREH